MGKQRRLFSMNLHFPYLDKRLDFRYSLIEGGLGEIGVLKPYTVLEAPPFFADPDVEDYRLKGISPCRDAGDPDTTGLGLQFFDLSGNQRLVGEQIDLGAYEFAYPLNIEKEGQASPLIELYPNPSSGILRIRAPGDLLDGPFTIQITDLQGKIRKKSLYDKLPHDLNLNEFREGIYLIIIYGSDGLISCRKVIRG
jgi:hypothetical protein